MNQQAANTWVWPGVAKNWLKPTKWAKTYWSEQNWAPGCVEEHVIMQKVLLAWGGYICKRSA